MQWSAIVDGQGSYLCQYTREFVRQSSHNEDTPQQFTHQQ
jgi:hypothetical protein